MFPMAKKEKNFAFVDSQNLNLSIRSLGWKLDFKRFRKYLADKYSVQKAYLFIGFIDANEELYASLKEAGFVCVFKPTLTYKDGTTKGNCDAELVLQAMIELPNYDKAVIVTGDGDFYCLIKLLLEWGKLETVLIPDRLKFSALLKLKEFRPYLHYMNDLRGKLALRQQQGAEKSSAAKPTPKKLPPKPQQSRKKPTPKHPQRRRSHQRRQKKRPQQDGT